MSKNTEQKTEHPGKVSANNDLLCAYYPLLHHSLGITDPEQFDSYRNYFEASGGHSDLPGLLKLCEAGLMVEGNSPSFCHEDSRTFYVTQEGRAMAFETRPKPPKLTRGQRRYRAYLKSEADESFGDWLKDPYWDDYRRQLGA